MTLGLPYIREKADISLERLSKELEVSLQNINQWEKGKRPIPEIRKEKLEKFFSIPREYFGKELTKVDKLEVQKLLILNNENFDYREAMLYSIDKKIECEKLLERVEQLIKNNLNAKIIWGIVKILNDSNSDDARDLRRFLKGYIELD